MKKNVLFFFLFFASFFQIQAQCSLSCLGSATINLDASGKATVIPQLLLNSSTGCTGTINVAIFDAQNQNIGNQLNCTHVGQTFSVRLTDSVSGVVCWSSIKVEDRIKPVLVCKDTIVLCNQATTPDAIGYPSVSDNCSSGTKLQVKYADVLNDLPCLTKIDNVPVTGRITRTWTATDAFGNSSTCSQRILLKRAVVDDVAFPASLELDCKQDPKDLKLTGQPTINGKMIDPTGLCELVLSYTDKTVDECAPSGYQLVREWKAIDYCTNEFKVFAQIIKVSDKTPPTIICPANLTVGTQTGNCNATVSIPTPTVTDNCSTPTVTASWQFGTGFGPFLNIPVGEYTVTYTAKDPCGNTNTCNIKVNVIDDDASTAICSQELEVALKADGKVTVEAKTFDKGSYDNCAITKYEVSRDGITFAPSVILTCADIKTSPNNITLKVTDKAGLSAVCVAKIKVWDIDKPVITCPADITLNCKQDFKDLSLTGTATATDNCTVTNISHTDNNQLSRCGTGKIVRTWTATDAIGNKSTCNQTITIIDDTPFEVFFPADVTIDGCASPLDTSLTKIPTFKGIDCEVQAGVSFSDRVYNLLDKGCYKVIRDWKVINWCVYNPNNAGSQEGLTLHEQLIQIIDTKAPQVSIPSDMTVEIAANACEADVKIPFPTANDCNTSIYWTNNAAFSLLKNEDASGRYPSGEHTITFTATDGCGNAASGSMKLTVVDKRVPNPICNKGVDLVLDSDGKATLTKAMIENGTSSDNCTPYNELKFSIFPTEFTCQNVGDNIVRLTIQDLAGNTAYCQTTVSISDNNQVCGATTEGLVISGKILSEDQKPLKGVKVTLNGTAQTTTTDDAGAYSFKNLVSKVDYSVKPQLVASPENGVTTLDVIAMRKYILGLENLASSYKMIAGDVNRNASVSATDIVALRQVILGLTSPLNENNAWRFVDTKQQFDANNVFANPISEELIYRGLGQNISNADFIALKAGDVNNSADVVNLGSRNQAILGLNIEDKTLIAGKEYEIPIKTEQFNQILGFQFALNFDKNLAEMMSVEKGDLANFSISNTAIHPDFIQFSWEDNQLAAQSLDAAQTLFVLKIKAKRNVSLAEILNINQHKVAEAYRPSNDKIQLLSIQLNQHTKKNDLVLHQNFPNPYTNSTTIPFELNEETQLTLSILDVQGRLVKTYQGFYPKGYNEIQVNANEFGNATGLFFYHLTTPKHQSATKKMLLNR